MARMPKHFEIEDFDLSGPKRWPVTHAMDTHARFLQHRPELYYLSARREAQAIAEHEGQDSAAADRIRCSVVLIWERETRRGPIKHQETIGSFVHSKTKDIEEDVSEFVLNLHRFLKRTISEEPDPYLTVQLQFAMRSGAKGKRLGTLQARWW